MTMRKMKEPKERKREGDTNGTEDWRDTEIFNRNANEQIWTFQMNVFVIEKIYFVN